MKYFACAVATTLCIGWPKASQAQAPLVKQHIENTKEAIDNSDTTFCATESQLTADDMFECGTDAYKGINNPVAMKWWRRAANLGNYRAQYWLGMMYGHRVVGSGDISLDYVQAYKWLDIAAATHAAAIKRLPVTANASNADSNEYEINARDDLAKKMTAAQIAEAQKIAHEWRPKM